MKKVLVRYEGWGENWPLGTLADDGRRLLFEYYEIALARHGDLDVRGAAKRLDAMLEVVDQWARIV